MKKGKKRKSGGRRRCGYKVHVRGGVRYYRSKRWAKRFAGKKRKVTKVKC